MRPRLTPISRVALLGAVLLGTILLAAACAAPATPVEPTSPPLTPVVITTPTAILTPTPTLEPTATAIPSATPEPVRIVLPEPGGPYPVGRALYFMVDERRGEPHTETAADVRQLSVEIWYPAQPPPGARPGVYMDPRIAVSFGLPASINESLAHAISGPPLAQAEQAFPVLLLNPGFSALHLEYAALAEDLASHGYVVVAIAHPYVTAATLLPGNVVAVYGGPEQFEQAWPGRDPFDAELDDMWVPDTRFVMDSLAELNAADPTGRFTGRLDLSQFGLLGHSFGGRTAAAVCQIDTRCTAALSMDGGVPGEIIDEGMRVPYLRFAAGDLEPFEIAEARGVFESARADTYLLTIPGSRHFDFADGYYIAEQGGAPDLNIRYGTVGSERMIAITRAYTLAFFDATLRSTPSPLLEGPSEAFPEVEFEARPAGG